MKTELFALGMDLLSVDCCTSPHVGKMPSLMGNLHEPGHAKVKLSVFHSKQGLLVTDSVRTQERASHGS